MPARVVKEGQVYGRLTVIRAYALRGDHWYHECRCSCGSAPRLVQGRSLRLKDRPTLSCGCILSEKARVFKVGQVYGRLTVIRTYVRRGNDWYHECQCSCGSAPRLVQGCSLRLKDRPTLSCGCIRNEKMRVTSKKRWENWRKKRFCVD